MAVTEFVKEQRKRHKMPQQSLAMRAGVGIRFIRELEAGKPTLRTDKVGRWLLDVGSWAFDPNSKKDRPE